MIRSTNTKNLSFTDVKDLSIENENFIDIYLINKTNYKVVIKKELIGFIYQNITFKTIDKEIFHTNSLDLFSALYHLIYENENEIKEIFIIGQNETLEQIATLERKTNFKCKLNIAKYNQKEQEFIQMFDFQHSHLTQTQFEKVVEIILNAKICTPQQNAMFEKRKLN